MGLKITRVLGANSTNLTLISASVKAFFGGIFTNHYASASQFVKLYDKASAAPVLASDTPFMTIEIPSGGVVSAYFDKGIDLTNGLGLAITGAYADNDTTASHAAGDVICNILTN